MKHSLEVVRRIYDDEEGVYLQVGPDGDGLGLIVLSAPGEGNREYYGNISLTLNAKQARLVAEALIAAANEIGNKSMEELGDPRA